MAVKSPTKDDLLRTISDMETEILSLQNSVDYHIEEEKKYSDLADGLQAQLDDIEDRGVVGDSYQITIAGINAMGEFMADAIVNLFGKGGEVDTLRRLEALSNPRIVVELDKAIAADAFLYGK